MLDKARRQFEAGRFPPALLIGRQSARRHSLAQELMPTRATHDVLRSQGHGHRTHGGAMAKIKVHAGDFPEQKAQVSFGSMNLISKNAKWLGENIPFTEIKEVDEASDENVKRIGGTVGWGAAGGVLLGPVGLLAGLLAGGRGKDVTFVCRLKNGRRLLGTTDNKTFTKMRAAIF